MLILSDKSLLLLGSSLFYILMNPHPYNILIILGSAAFSFSNSFFDKKEAQIIIAIGYSVISICFPDFLYFLPLLAYDSYPNYYIYPFFLLILIVTNFNNLQLVVLLIAFSTLGILMKYKSKKIANLEAMNRKIKDDSEELRILQENKQKELLERQDYEVQLAKAEERNRIAREIHDSVGHNLSSSLLQIGALIAINKNEAMDEPLQNMKETLSEGMNSIRSSVHNLHEDTLNLEKEINSIVEHFSFCDIALNYQCNNLMDLKLKYCFINILKESLNNIMKHSNASKVDVSLVEFATFYQFVIQDNGTNATINEGMGIKNMQTRVEQYEGIFRITNDEGVKIFITIPKEMNS